MFLPEKQMCKTIVFSHQYFIKIMRLANKLVFFCFNGSWDLKQNFYFTLTCGQCDIILQVKRILCCHTCYPVLPAFASCRLAAFKTQASVIPSGLHSQLQAFLTAVQAHCIFPLLHITILLFYSSSHLTQY